MTRDEILVRTKEMFMRYGIRSVTMDDIARELGISKKTLYQHVDNKDDLIKAIIENYIENETECMKEISQDSVDPIDQMLTIARHVITILRDVNPKTMYDLKKYYRPYFKMMDAFHLDHVYHVIKRNLIRGVEEGLYRENIDADIIAKLYVGKTMLISDEELFPAADYDRHTLFAQYMIYHLRGILSEKGVEKLKTYQPIV